MGNVGYDMVCVRNNGYFILMEGFELGKGKWYGGYDRVGYISIIWLRSLDFGR